MTISPSSLAAGIGVSANNTPFAVAALNVPRKVLVVASPLAANEGSFTELTPELVTNVGYHANKAGRRSAAAKMLTWIRETYDGELWYMPLFEPNAPTAATGHIVFAGTCTAAGQLHLYLGSEKIDGINIAIGDDGENVVDKIVAAVTAQVDLPATCVKNATPEQVDFTAASAGPFGNFQFSFNLGFEEYMPAGITATITDMTGGAGVADLESALDALGADDEQNGAGFTAIVHINGSDTTSLNDLSTWNGLGNTVSGNWGKLVHKPVRSLIADTAAGSGGLSTLIALGNGRKETDRTSGCVAVPGSPSSPYEIAAKVVGIMEQIAAQRPEENYVGQVIPGIYPGAVADRWTSSYDNRDTATKAGITATRVEGTSVLLSNVVTFYHSAAIQVSSNGYREMRNIAILQNLLYSLYSEFGSVKWQGFTIVADPAKVSNAVNREKVRSIESVRTALNSLADDFESKAWIYDAAFTKTLLKEESYIAIREASDGFNIVFPCRLSGVGNIIDLALNFDINIAK